GALRFGGRSVRWSAIIFPLLGKPSRHSATQIGITVEKQMVFPMPAGTRPGHLQTVRSIPETLWFCNQILFSIWGRHGNGPGTGFFAVPQACSETLKSLIPVPIRQPGDPESRVHKNHYNIRPISRRI